MAADSTLVLSLVEEFVSGVVDSKAKEAAAGSKLTIVYFKIFLQHGWLYKRAGDAVAHVVGCATQRQANLAP